MAGAAASAGLLAVVAVLSLGVATAGAASVAQVRLAGAADVAALAAADVALGVTAGDPCEWAGRLAARHGARLEACVLDGAVATVTVATTFGALPLRAHARAGPPPG